MFVYYDESILTISSSVRKYFKLNTYYPSDKELDAFLDKQKPKKIINIIIDGLGANALNRVLAPTSFLIEHQFKKLQTVMPSNYATEAIISGKTFNLCSNGDVQTIKIVDINDLKLLYKGNNNLVYVQIDEYKKMIIKHNVDSFEANNCLNEINEKIKELKENIDNDTLIIVYGNCGYIKINRRYNLDESYSQYFNLPPVLENRCISFFVREDKTLEFEKSFKRDFEKDYILLNKKQVIDSKMFGYDDNCQTFIDMLGSHLAVAKNDLILESEKMLYPYDYSSGGILDDELYVPIIVIK